MRQGFVVLSTSQSGKEIESAEWFASREEADRLCIYTYDNRCVVRMLEDEGMVDDHMELVDPSASRDEQNVAIAYSFWQNAIYDEVRI